MFASDIERRILGHLPAWAADEEAYVQAELDGGAATSVRSYDVGQLTARLGEDRAIPTRTEEQVSTFLSELQSRGLAVETEGQWKMTEAGLEALKEPALAEHEQTSGPVQIGIGG